MSHTFKGDHKYHGPWTWTNLPPRRYQVVDDTMLEVFFSGTPSMKPNPEWTDADRLDLHVYSLNDAKLTHELAHRLLRKRSMRSAILQVLMFAAIVGGLCWFIDWQVAAVVAVVILSAFAKRWWSSRKLARS